MRRGESTLNACILQRCVETVKDGIELSLSRACDKRAGLEVDSDVPGRDDELSSERDRCCRRERG